MKPLKSVILTPNQRLARIAREKYDALMIEQKKTTFVSVQAYSLQTFIYRFWESLIRQNLLIPKYFLNTFQQTLVWQKIIAENNPAGLNDLSSLAVKAWTLLSQWQFNLSDTAFSRTEETKCFKQWAMNYQRRLFKKNWIDNEGIFKDIIDLLQKKTLSLRLFLPKEIVLLGFNDFSAREKKFFDCLDRQGVKICHDNYAQTPKILLKTDFPDSNAEIETVARWAYQKILESPDQTIACVFPRLTADRNKIIASFQRYFGDEKYRRLINVSLGKPLSAYALVRSALVSLELLQNKFPAENISEFLLSPYLDFLSLSVSEKALLDQKLKPYLPVMIHKNALLQQEKFKSLTFLEKSFPEFFKADPKEWADIFFMHLKFVGFPGQRALNSEDYQLMSHFQALIENFSHLSVILGKLNLASAVYYFKKMAEKSIFQPQRQPGVKIEILGILEAAGLTFDCVWMAGMNENAWPLPSSPNPFLPFSLIKENEKFYAKMTEQLFLSGREIILSYAKVEKDTALYPSAAMYGLPEMPHSVLKKLFDQNIYKISEKNIRNSIQIKLEERQNPYGPKMLLKEIKPCASEVLKDQAACPFRAFVKYRLGGKETESSQLGFKAAAKGNIIHKILETIFTQITDHSMLCALSQSELKIFVQKTIQKALQAYSARVENTVFFAAEEKRLEKLILAWLKLEKSRQFFTVAACEEKIDAYLGDLPLRLRIDRIDKIGENSYILIDYKTGSQSIKPDPYDEPQLPLYCVSASHLAIESLALAYLRSHSKDMRFKEFKNINQKKAQWTSILHTIAQEYLSGNAAVQPRRGAETCRFCGLSSVCRIKTIEKY